MAQVSFLNKFKSLNKSLNDEHGREVGDQMLEEVAAKWRRG